MTEKEICVRMTRAAVKRKSIGTEDERFTKKRVVLGELPNLSNISVLSSFNQISKPAKSLGALSKLRKTAPVEFRSDIDSRSDDPKMCGPYVTDIYEYLRQMEVNNLSVWSSFSILRFWVLSEDFQFNYMLFKCGQFRKKMIWLLLF